MALQTPHQMVKSAVQDLIWVIEHQTKAFLTSVEAACDDIEATDEKIDLQLLTNDIKEAVCQIVSQIQKAVCQHTGIDLGTDQENDPENVVDRAEEMITRALDNFHRETLAIKTENETQLDQITCVKESGADESKTYDCEVGSSLEELFDKSDDEGFSSAKKKKRGRKKGSFKIKIKKPVEIKDSDDNEVDNDDDGDNASVKTETYSPTIPKSKTKIFNFKSKKTKLRSNSKVDKIRKKHKKSALNNINSVVKKRPYTKVEHSRFRCKVCVKAFSSKATLKTHLGTSKHLKKVQERRESTEGDESRADPVIDDLDEAMEIDEPEKEKKKQNNPPVPQDCTLCGETMKSRYLLKQHYQKCHPEDVEKNACDQCKKPFPTEEALAEHIKTHKKKRHCVICDKTFSSTSRYKEHLGTLSHYRKKQELAMKNELDGKQVDENEDEALLFPHAMRICSICGQTFSSKTSLYNHMHAIHSTSNDFICHICGKSWNCRAKLSAHMDTHLKRYKCDFCGESFSRKRLRDSHRRIHTGEQPFKCPHCPKAFREGYLLRKHVKTHSTARPFSCGNCDAKFKIKGHLDRHMSQVHNSERPHKCIYCAEGFIEKRHLQKHLFQHTGESEFRCTFCGKFLANKNSLNTHLMQYHNKPLPVLPSAEHLLQNTKNQNEPTAQPPQQQPPPQPLPPPPPPTSEPLPVVQPVTVEPPQDFTMDPEARIKEEAQKVLNRFQEEIEGEVVVTNSQLRRNMGLPDPMDRFGYRPTDTMAPTNHLFGDADRSIFQPQTEADRILFPQPTDNNRLVPLPPNDVDRSLFPLRNSGGQHLFNPPASEMERAMLPQNEVERAMLQYAYERHMLQ